MVDKVLHGQLKVADAARPSLGTDRQLRNVPVKNPVQLSKSTSCHHPSQKTHYSEQNHTPSSTMQPLVFRKEAVWGCPPSCPYRVSHGRGGVGHSSCASCVSYWKAQDFISLSALQWYYIVLFAQTAKCHVVDRRTSVRTLTVVSSCVFFSSPNIARSASSSPGRSTSFLMWYVWDWSWCWVAWQKWILQVLHTWLWEGSGDSTQETLDDSLLWRGFFRSGSWLFPGLFKYFDT